MGVIVKNNSGLFLFRHRVCGILIISGSSHNVFINYLLELSLVLLGLLILLNLWLSPLSDRRKANSHWNLAITGTLQGLTLTVTSSFVSVLSICNLLKLDLHLVVVLAHSNCIEVHTVDFRSSDIMREQFKRSLKSWLFECAYGTRHVWESVQSEGAPKKWTYLLTYCSFQLEVALCSSSQSGLGPQWLSSFWTNEENARWAEIHIRYWGAVSQKILWQS